MSHFNHNKKARLVGIDISQEQLEKNNYLDEKILGDIQNINSLPASAYDLIICWDVLEHLPHPELALKNFHHAVNEGGLIFLASPNVMTLRGLITKFTPHWFHILYAKYIVGSKDAGQPGTYPFISFHRFSMAPMSIVRFAEKNQMTVEMFRFSYWEQPEYQYKFFKFVWDITNHLVNIISFKKIGTDMQKGFQIILQKNIITKSVQ